MKIEDAIEYINHDVVLHMKDGTNRNETVLDVDYADDNDENVDYVVILSGIGHGPDGSEVQAGDGIPVNEIKSIEYDD